MIELHSWNASTRDVGARAVAGFSPRARPHGPIAAPIDWGELDPNVRLEVVLRAVGGLLEASPPAH